MPKRTFLSPLRKLVNFFQASRDRWKAKCREAKRQLNVLRRRCSRLKVQVDRWKQRCEEAEAALAAARVESIARSVSAGSNSQRGGRC